MLFIPTPFDLELDFLSDPEFGKFVLTHEVSDNGALKSESLLLQWLYLTVGQSSLNFENGSELIFKKAGIVTSDMAINMLSLLSQGNMGKRDSKMFLVDNPSFSFGVWPIIDAYSIDGTFTDIYGSTIDVSGTGVALGFYTILYSEKLEYASSMYLSLTILKREENYDSGEIDDIFKMEEELGKLTFNMSW